MVKKSRVSLLNRGKGRGGFGQNSPPSTSLPFLSRETEEGEMGGGGAWAGGPRAWLQAGVGEKGESDEGIPFPTSARAGAR